MASDPANEPTVYLVEDDAGVRRSLAFLIELSNHRVEVFASAQEFLAAYDPSRPGCLVLDVHLPGMSGVDLHQRLVRQGVRVPTIFLTGHAPPDVSDEARARGVIAVFEKPCQPEALLEVIERALGET